MRIAGWALDDVILERRAPVSRAEKNGTNTLESDPLWRLRRNFHPNGAKGYVLFATRLQAAEKLGFLSGHGFKVGLSMIEATMGL